MTRFMEIMTRAIRETCKHACYAADLTAAPSDLAARARRRVTRRLMPYLFLLYVVAYIDRINISFAGLQMTGELHFNDAVFGLGSGIFFIGYLLLGIPGAML